MEGELYIALQPDIMAHYEPAYKKLMSLPLAQRHPQETKYMDSLQKADKKWKRYYCISSEWVTNWLRYAESEDKNQYDPPGPVDNQAVMQKLCSTSKGEERKD